MPTAAEFTEAARRFEEAARIVEQAGRRPARSMGPRTMWGGRLTRQMNDVLHRGATDTGRAAAQLRSTAAECRRRAGVAGSVAAQWDAYDSAYSSYEAAVDDYNAGRTNTEPTAPKAPDSGPVWAEF